MTLSIRMPICFQIRIKLFHCPRIAIWQMLNCVKIIFIALKYPTTLEITVFFISNIMLRRKIFTILQNWPDSSFINFGIQSNFIFIDSGYANQNLRTGSAKIKNCERDLRNCSTDQSPTQKQYCESGIIFSGSGLSRSFWARRRIQVMFQPLKYG